MQKLSIEHRTTVDFIREEFHDITFNDERLKERFIKIMDSLSKKLTSCIRRTTTDQNEARQTYDFFKNPKVNYDGIFTCHTKQTAQRVNESLSNVILVIQDGMRLNFTSHKAKIDIGRISQSNGKDLYETIA